MSPRFFVQMFTGHISLLAHDAFVRTNRRAIAMMFVRLSACLPVHLGRTCVVIIRCTLSLDEESFRSAILQSDLYSTSSKPLTAAEYFDRYDYVLRGLASEFVPVVKLARRIQRLAKWMDSECFNLRRHTRRLEKRYRRTLSEDDRGPPSKKKPMVIPQN